MKINKCIKLIKKHLIKNLTNSLKIKKETQKYLKINKIMMI
jgi:hypothetical protein